MVKMATASAQQTISAWPISMLGIAAATERQRSTAIMRTSIPARARALILVTPIPINLAWRWTYAQGVAASTH